jgi:hypothetical protein
MSANRDFHTHKLQRIIHGSKLTGDGSDYLHRQGIMEIILHQPPIADVLIPGHCLPPNYRAMMRTFFFIVVNNLNNGCGSQKLMVGLELLQLTLTLSLTSLGHPCLQQLSNDTKSITSMLLNL